MLSVPQRYRRTDRRTDGRTDGRLTIAIPRFALRASRGKNAKRRSKTWINWRICFPTEVSHCQFTFRVSKFSQIKMSRILFVINHPGAASSWDICSPEHILPVFTWLRTFPSVCVIAGDSVISVGVVTVRSFVCMMLLYTRLVMCTLLVESITQLAMCMAAMCTC